MTRESRPFGCLSVAKRKPKADNGQTYQSADANLSEKREGLINLFTA